MSIIHGIIGSIQGGGSPPPSKYVSNVWYGAAPGEGYSTELHIDVANWDGSTIYWTVVGMGNPAANPLTDMTGSLSGSYGPGTGNQSTTVSTIGFVADNTTEGTEYWGVYVGSSPGANDYYTAGAWPISDLSSGGPMPGGDGSPGSGSWAGTNFTLTPSTNGVGNPGTAYSADVITWTIQANNSNYNGQTMYWWVDNNAVPASNWVENSNDGTVVLDSNGSATFSRTVVTNPTHGLFRMYVGFGLYQGFVTHGYIGV